jgi:hypothetical protein
VSEVVSIDVEAVAVLAAQLRSLGESLVRDSGGADRSVPVVPEDEDGLARAMVEFDEAREAFERRLGLVVESVAGTAGTSIEDVQRADGVGSTGVGSFGAIGRALGGLAVGS